MTQATQQPAESDEKRKSAEDAAKARADKIADSQIAPAYAAQAEALNPGPVYTLPDQAEGNPGVQGFVFRPHQEKNPGTGVEIEPQRFSEQVELEKAARGRRWEAAKAEATKRGDTLPERAPPRLRMDVSVRAHSVIEEDKLGAVAAAADALVAAIRDAGGSPKASVSGIPF